MNKFYLKYIFLFFSLGVIPCILSGQDKKKSSTQYVIDSLEHVLKTQKDDTNKVNTLNELSDNFETIAEYDSSLFIAGKAEALAEVIGRKEGQSRAFAIIGIVYYDRGNYKKGILYELKSLHIGLETNDESITTRALGNLGIIYYDLGDYTKALDYDYKALAIAQKLKNQYFISNNLGNLGNVYNEMGNYSKALEYQLKSLAIDTLTGSDQNISTDLGNIGDVYLNEHDYSKAVEYYLRSLSISRKAGIKEEISLCLSSVGNVYYDQGDYTTTLKYYFDALAIAREIGEESAIANITSTIGATYFRLRNYKLAKSFLDSALDIAKNIGDKKDIKDIYRSLAGIDSATGNYKNAFEDDKKYAVYRDSIANQEGIKKATQIEISYEFQKREDSIKADQERSDIVKSEEIRRKSIITYGMVVILLLSLISATLLISRQQIKHRKDKMLFEKNLVLSEKEKDLLKLEKLRMEDELVNAKIMLDDYIKNMVEKNTLLEQFKIELEDLKSVKDKEIDEKRLEYLEHLNTTAILTDEDWTKFKQLFEHVHKDFLKKLREKLPDLTQAEVRFICLTKLELGTKQMAGILGVSDTTIKQMRYRLRKKMELSGEDDLDKIVASI